MNIYLARKKVLVGKLSIYFDGWIPGESSGRDETLKFYAVRLPFAFVRVGTGGDRAFCTKEGIFFSNRPVREGESVRY